MYSRVRPEIPTAYYDTPISISYYNYTDILMMYQLCNQLNQHIII